MPRQRTHPRAQMIVRSSRTPMSVSTRCVLSPVASIPDDVAIHRHAHVHISLHTPLRCFKMATMPRWLSSNRVDLLRTLLQDDPAMLCAAPWHAQLREPPFPTPPPPCSLAAHCVVCMHVPLCKDA